MVSEPDSTWWKNGTVYQVYPSSFKDLNGDGLGDIPGIVSKLDYLKDLGVDIIWLSPHHDGPQVDMGYDISDYESVYPKYGTMADMDALIQGVHSRGLRIIVDLVINHTSDQHAWFQESRSSRDNPKRDWYIWKPAEHDKDGKRREPTNWRAFFGGSAWQWDEGSQEYYLHLFCPEQPDLNWENEETRNAIYASAVEFWLKKGVDGFRVDTVNLYSKDQSFPDASILDPNEEYQTALNIVPNGPRMHEFLREMHDKHLSKYDCMTIGELGGTDRARALRYISAAEKNLNMVFLFDVIILGWNLDQKYDVVPRAWTLPQFKAAWAEMQHITDGNDAWSTAFLENHDSPRSISRFGSDDPKYRVLSGKMLAVLLAGLSGTLFLYRGRGIGMVNFPREWGIEEYIDVESHNCYDHVKEKTNGDPKALEKVMDALQYLARDHNRSPMQWDASSYAGFTTQDGQKPWMRVHDLYQEINVQKQVDDPESLLSFWKKMLKVRKQHRDVLVHGTFELVDAANEETFTFVKKWEGRKAVVTLNFSDKEQPLAKLKDLKGDLKLVVSNYGKEERERLSAWEGRLYIVE